MNPEEQKPKNPVGRPRKAERDRGISIFLTQSHKARLRRLAGQIYKEQVAAGKTPVGINVFRSAALRSLMDQDWPVLEQTSERRQHQETDNVINVYMTREYLAKLDGFVERVKEETGKDYNRGMAVRDLIDLHLSNEVLTVDLEQPSSATIAL